MATKIIPVSDLRRKTSDVIKAVQSGGQVVYVTQHGRPAVVLVDYEDYEALMAQLEDLSDLASLEAAVDEPVRPYDEFLAELGSPETDES
jgi:prevent-host-death family protein